MRRRVLIVTSTYAPAMMADMHRARLLAWEMPSLGWEVEVLAPDTGFQVPASVDPDSDAFFHAGTCVHRAPMRFARLYRFLRLGSIGWRSLVPMNKVATELFRHRHFDMVYFSTTQFNLFLLGWWWRRCFGVPYVLDFHDPCFREKPGYSGGTPRGLKRLVNSELHRVIESIATRSASGLVSVSPGYIDIMRSRYARSNPGWLEPARHGVIPFAGSERDLAEASTASVRRPAAKGPERHIIYVGAGGPIMVCAFGVICRALAELKRRHDPVIDGIRLGLYGTMLGWRAGDPKHLLEVARSFGVEEYVHEDPRRISYRRSLEMLTGADGVLVLGVADEDYMPSKLYPYALSGKPLLAVLNERSPPYAAMRTTPDLGNVIGFGVDGSVLSGSTAVTARFLGEVMGGRRFDRAKILEPYLASAMAKRHVDLFEACLAAG